jgi:hypothetical protein
MVTSGIPLLGSWYVFCKGTVREHKIIVKNEIQELRTKINKYLDKLQENMMKELTEAHKQITNETQELLVSLDEKQNLLEVKSIL